MLFVAFLETAEKKKIGNTPSSVWFMKRQKFTMHNSKLGLIGRFCDGLARIIPSKLQTQNISDVCIILLFFIKFMIA